MNWKSIVGEPKKWLIPPLYLLCYHVLSKTGIGCIWRFLFGIPCPGCGYTRGVFSALRLDFTAAWRYHPMFFTFPLIVIFFLRDGKITGNRKTDLITAIVVGIGFLLTWIGRLLYGFPF